MKDIIKRVVFRPYTKDCGPVFSLTMWDSHTTDDRGCTNINYEFRQDGKVILSGLNYSGSAYSVGMGTADDSDASVAGLMGFITLRPGDTDEEFFKDYSEAAIDFCNNHAEALACEVSARYGEQ